MQTLAALGRAQTRGARGPPIQCSRPSKGTGDQKRGARGPYADRGQQRGTHGLRHDTRGKTRVSGGFLGAVLVANTAALAACRHGARCWRHGARGQNTELAAYRRLWPKPRQLTAVRVTTAALAA